MNMPLHWQIWNENIFLIFSARCSLYTLSNFSFISFFILIKPLQILLFLLAMKSLSFYYSDKFFWFCYNFSAFIESQPLELLTHIAIATIIRIASISPAPIPYLAKKSSDIFEIDTPEYCSQTIIRMIPTISAPRRCTIHLNSITPFRYLCFPPKFHE